MHVRVRPREVVRRVFPTWSISIPSWLDETFVHEEGYWHAWGTDRSVSLSSVEITDDAGRPVAAEEIARQLPRAEGEPLETLPPDLIGWCVELDSVPPAVASRALCGMLAIDGRILVATITCDDREWVLRTWTSIRSHPVRSRRRAVVRPRDLDI